MAMPVGSLPTFGVQSVRRAALALGVVITTFADASEPLSVGAAYVIKPARLSESECITAAATRYRLPPLLVLAIRQVEGGTAGAVSHNTNATYDIGPMQINSIHLPVLRKAGITETALLSDACLNIHVGAWILRREIDAAPDVWTGVGRYHSRTPRLNERYQVRVWRRLERLAVESMQLLGTDD